MGGVVSEKRKVVCTGGAGFIGSHLVDRLVDDGWDVRVYDNLVNGREENLQACCKFNTSDIVDDFVDDFNGQKHNAWGDVLKDVDVVFHLAALGSVPFSLANPDKVFKTNCDGTRMILEGAARSGTRVVFASSASYYGEGDGTVSEFGPTPKTEDMSPAPLNHYAASKVFGEQWGRIFHELHGLPFVALRFFNVFGPRQRADSDYAAVVPKFVNRALRGGLLELHGGGVQTRDLTYVDNVVDACIAVAESPAEKVAGESFNVCAGGRVSINDLAVEIGNHACPDGVLKFKATEARPGDIRDSFGTNDKLQRATGWRPRVDWREGIKRTVEALRHE